MVNVLRPIRVGLSDWMFTCVVPAVPAVRMPYVFDVCVHRVQQCPVSISTPRTILTHNTTGSLLKWIPERALYLSWKVCGLGLVPRRVVGLTRGIK
eukprot:1193343-Prorocentrum_minimum.AAC.4